MTKARNRRLVVFMSLATLVTMLSAGPADAGQSRPADSRRLDQLSREVQAELRRVDEQSVVVSARLRDQLEDLRDEIGYLRVVQRRGETIQDREYRQLETRLQSVRQELRTAGVGSDVARPRADGIRPRSGGVRPLGRAGDEVPVGTELDVRLQQELSSETAMVERDTRRTAMMREQG